MSNKEEERKQITIEEPNNPEPKKAQSMRKINIETDGNGFKIIQAQCTNLELKEICRQIIMKLGG